ncbi:hypothetical protein MXM19_08395 [Aeromonas caviae]|uniref:hypothetical protein n=1 Tax=Aeromonas caviae TaxID=648 RepID=UPI002DBAFC03|nr:hypothetical protein [Aeromonas caviae]MEB6640865.1 hypothetical protein [Aeromonas caviae]
MARDSKHIKGLDNLNKLLDSLVDPKFRARALRSAAKQTLAPVKEAVQAAAPALIKDDVVIKVIVNTSKKIKIPQSGYIPDKKYNELYAEVTFDMKKGKYGTESAYGMAMILELGRRNPLARAGKGEGFKVFGKVTDEAFRYIGTTKGLYFVERIRHQQKQAMEENFLKFLLQEVEKEIKKQDKRNSKK